MKTKYLLFIIDDDTRNLLQVSRQLRKSLNCTTRIFKCETDVVLNASEDKPDIIITNYRINNSLSSKMNGDYLLDWIKLYYEKTPIIMYSAHRNIEMATKLIRKGVADFVVRDENFLKKITERTRTQLLNIVNKGTEKIPIKKIVLTILFVVTTMLFLSSNYLNLLPLFSTILLLVSGFLLFLKQPHKRYTY